MTSRVPLHPKHRVQRRLASFAVRPGRVNCRPRVEDLLLKSIEAAVAALGVVALAIEQIHHARPLQKTECWAVAMLPHDSSQARGGAYRHATGFHLSNRGWDSHAYAVVRGRGGTAARIGDI